VLLLKGLYFKGFGGYITGGYGYNLRLWGFGITTRKTHP
jgi:hypothetical protein